MAWASGSNAELLFQKEATYATSPTGSSIAAIQLPFNSCDLKESQPPQQSNVIGAGRTSARPWYGNKVVSGTLTGPIDLLAFGWILRAALGAPTTTGSASPYTHVFKPTTTLTSFLLDKGLPDGTLYYLYNGCVATGLTINFTPSGQLQYSMTILGAKETKGTSAYQASPTSDLSKPATIFHNSDVTLSEGGSGTTNIEEFTFSLNNNSVIGYGMNGSGQGTGACLGAPHVSGRIKAFFDSDALLLKGRAHTESKLSAVMTSSTSSLTVAVNELEYSYESPAITGPGGIYTDLTYVGYTVDDAGASDCVITLVTTQASYA